MARLEAAAGGRFACGFVLHDGDGIQQAAAKQLAMPGTMLWEA